MSQASTANTLSSMNPSHDSSYIYGTLHEGVEVEPPEKKDEKAVGLRRLRIEFRRPRTGSQKTGTRGSGPPSSTSSDVNSASVPHQESMAAGDTFHTPTAIKGTTGLSVDVKSNDQFRYVLSVSNWPSDGRTPNSSREHAEVWQAFEPDTPEEGLKKVLRLISREGKFSLYSALELREETTKAFRARAKQIRCHAPRHAAILGKVASILVDPKSGQSAGETSTADEDSDSPDDKSPIDLREPIEEEDGNPKHESPGIGLPDANVQRDLTSPSPISASNTSLFNVLDPALHTGGPTGAESFSLGKVDNERQDESASSKNDVDYADAREQGAPDISLSPDDSADEADFHEAYSGLRMDTPPEPNNRSPSPTDLPWGSDNQDDLVEDGRKLVPTVKATHTEPDTINDYDNLAVPGGFPPSPARSGSPSSVYFFATEDHN
ncbi:hypothetical protein QFC21_005854 [Naganishia friedmannii]|uniref:Uncharacterized protein n=1 Tax=Naganishia friedmannii TaxID=89922 RepID=A0ACC2V810_9TREE|nr:hypothetical protein QFC21_005854 [Naganishia friedmannii]